MSPNSHHNAVAGHSAQSTAGTVEETMLDNHGDFAAFCRRHRDIEARITMLECDHIGFRANVGTLMGERFDFPFNSGAFYEILEKQAGVEATGLTPALVVDAICGCAASKPAMFGESSLSHDAGEIVREASAKLRNLAELNPSLCAELHAIAESLYNATL